MPAGYDTCGGGRYQAHRIKRRRNRPRQTSATGQPRRSRNVRAGAEVGWRAEPTPSVDRRRRTGDGAPYEANCKDKQQTHAVRYPEEGASRTPPPTVVARCRFQRSREVQFITPAALYAASLVSQSPVGCTVLGAPWLRDCRGGLDADVRPDRFCPRYPRCVNRVLTDQRFIFRGHSPRTIGGREETAPAVSYAATFVSHPP